MPRVLIAEDDSVIAAAMASHLRHAGMEVALAIETLAILRGRLSPRAHALVVEWASLHADDLRADWELARLGQPLRRIEPLR